MNTSLPIPGVTPAREAVALLFHRHGDAVYRLGRTMCRNPANAEDLVQETFLRAQRAWDGFEGRASALTWLFAIAARACRRMERRRAGEPAAIDGYREEADPRESTAAGSHPLEELTRHEAAAAVRDAVAALPETFRLPLFLKDLEGLSVTDVAAVLGLKPATVKTRAHRARAMLGVRLRPGSSRGATGAHSRQECLDLVQARQEAFDRGVTFPLAEQVVCERCQPVFRAMQLTRTACEQLAAGRMPAPLRTALEHRLQP